MSILMPILITVHLLVCVLMIVVVLMQRPRSEGLGSAFGGGITDNVFGSQTTAVLSRFTTWMAIVFFVVTLLLSIITAKTSSSKTAIQMELLSAPVPQAEAAPTDPVIDASSTPAPETTVAPEATPVSDSKPVPESTPLFQESAPAPSATPES